MDFLIGWPVSGFAFGGCDGPLLPEDPSRITSLVEEAEGCSPEKPCGIVKSRMGLGQLLTHSETQFPSL